MAMIFFPAGKIESRGI